MPKFLFWDSSRPFLDIVFLPFLGVPLALICSPPGVEYFESCLYGGFLRERVPPPAINSGRRSMSQSPSASMTKGRSRASFWVRLGRKTNVLQSRKPHGFFHVS